MGRIIPFHVPLAPPGIGKAGVRIQESGVRSQNEEHLVRTFCSVFRALRSSLTGWVFLADPAAAGHAIVLPRFPVTISRVMESIKEKPRISEKRDSALPAPAFSSPCRQHKSLPASDRNGSHRSKETTYGPPGPSGRNRFTAAFAGLRDSAQRRAKCSSGPPGGGFSRRETDA